MCMEPPTWVGNDNLLDVTQLNFPDLRQCQPSRRVRRRVEVMTTMLVSDQSVSSIHVLSENLRSPPPVPFPQVDYRLFQKRMTKSNCSASSSTAILRDEKNRGGGERGQS